MRKTPPQQQRVYRRSRADLGHDVYVSISTLLCITLLIFLAQPVGLMADALVTTIGATQAGRLEQISRDIERRMERSSGTPLADKLEDALAKVNAAADKLRLARPDRQGALGELEGAVGDLEATVSAGQQRRGGSFDVMDSIAGAARDLANDAIGEARAGRRNASKITEARQALARGDARRRARGFKDAVAAYKDAAAKAEGA